VARTIVKFFAYKDSDVYVEWGTHDIEYDLDPNESQTLVVAYSVDPGSYRAYVLVDSDNTLEEANEDDNEAVYDFTMP
jgi:subtilase family serine protease